MRSLHGTRARVAASHLKGPEIPGFRMMIADATWVKINTWPELVKDVVGNDLPFRMYHTSEGNPLPVVNALAAWYVPVMEEIAKTLKKVQETEKQKTWVPDFSFLERSTYNRFNNQQ